MLPLAVYLQYFWKEKRKSTINWIENFGKQLMMEKKKHFFWQKKTEL